MEAFRVGLRPPFEIPLAKTRFKNTQHFCWGAARITDHLPDLHNHLCIHSNQAADTQATN
jgi:hypothetical protein